MMPTTTSSSAAAPSAVGAWTSSCPSGHYPAMTLRLPSGAMAFYCCPKGYVYPSSRGAMSTCDRLLLATGIAPDSVAPAHAPAVTVLWKRADPPTTVAGSLAPGMTLTVTLPSGVTPSVLQIASSLTRLAAPSTEPFYGPLDFNSSNSDSDTGTGETFDATALQNGTVPSRMPIPSSGSSMSSGVPFGVGLAISIIVPVVIITMIALALLLYRRRRLRERKAARAPATPPPPSAPRGEAFHELHAEDIPIPPDHTPTAWIPRVPIELLAPKQVDDVDTTIRRLRSERERVREHLQRLRMMEELEAEERRLEQELQDRLEIED